MNLSSMIKIENGLAYAQGTAARAGTEADTQDYEGVMFIVSVGAVEAAGTNSIKAQQDTATGMGSAADLLGTSISIAVDDDDQIFWLDIYRPRERFVRCYVSKDASKYCSESVLNVLYGYTKAPCDNNVADAITGELHASPAEGTA